MLTRPTGYAWRSKKRIRECNVASSCTTARRMWDEDIFSLTNTKRCRDIQLDSSRACIMRHARNVSSVHFFSIVEYCKMVELKEGRILYCCSIAKWFVRNCYMSSDMRLFCLFLRYCMYMIKTLAFIQKRKLKYKIFPYKLYKTSTAFVFFYEKL